MTELPHRKIRSFVRRPGRVTSAQRRALKDLTPLWCLSIREQIDMSKTFGRNSPRVLDIGFGDGEALVTLAVNNPDVDYLGIEVHEPGIGHLLLLLQRAGIKNVRIIQHDAVEVIEEMLMDHQFDVVNMFFPDPWPKKRHHKRRLIQPLFIHNIGRILRSNGVLHIATDWKDYALHIKNVLSENKKFTEISYNENDSLLQRPPTKFERRGKRLGHITTDLLYRLI
ncbi:MAG: tRNA (guanosine(46)-N7)-methyltransferase TrmB [Rhodospirillaceae bacterium]|nr:tRNA (guanosine(46)-N7)-methyltransferase TrmB [Rhodospirillaceae bacterium]|tara:strand:+ start:77 stop:751 length:675 start_codon:yes stop_codon:yes gene_type:complete